MNQRDSTGSIMLDDSRDENSSKMTNMPKSGALMKVNITRSFKAKPPALNVKDVI